MLLSLRIFFFFNDTATTEIYTLSLHDALPISVRARRHQHGDRRRAEERARALVPRGDHGLGGHARPRAVARRVRSEEHTSELQSRQYLVCRLLLEKKKNIPTLHSSPQRPKPRL